MKELTAENFALLLQWLSADPQIAAERYNQLRRRLIRFFAGRRCLEAERLADEVFDRAAVKLATGEQFTTSAEIYCLGVARNVALENFRGTEQRRTSLEELTVSSEPRVPSHQELEERFREEEFSNRERIIYLSCLRDCLSRFNPKQKELLEEYYQGQKAGENKEVRKAQAKRLGIKTEALTLRILRLRRKLADCIRACARPQLAK